MLRISQLESGIWTLLISPKVGKGNIWWWKLLKWIRNRSTQSILPALVEKRIVNTDIWEGMNNRSWLSKGILEILLWQEKITRLSKELSYNLETRIVIAIVTRVTTDGKMTGYWIEVAIRRRMRIQLWRKSSNDKMSKKTGIHTSRLCIRITIGNLGSRIMKKIE